MSGDAILADLFRRILDGRATDQHGYSGYLYLTAPEAPRQFITLDATFDLTEQEAEALRRAAQAPVTPPC